MEFEIKPIQFPKTAVKMRMEVSVILNERAIVYVYFYEQDIEFQPLEIKEVIIEGQEYKNWGNDDNYIKKLVFSKLGISY